MQDLVESAWRWRDAGTSMKRRRRIVSGEIMEFLDFSTVSPRPRKTLKGVGLRACLAGLSMKPQSSLANAPAFELRSVTVRMHRSTTTHQPKSFEPPTTDVALIEGCLRKRNPAKQALKPKSSLTNAPAFQLRRVAVRMHRSTTTNQPKSCEPRLTTITLIGGCLRKRNSAKQALSNCIT